MEFIVLHPGKWLEDKQLAIPSTLRRIPKQSPKMLASTQTNLSCVERHGFAQCFVSGRDMKAESDRLYSGYLHEAILLSSGGLVAIIGLLLMVFRSPGRVVRNIVPLAAAVITVTAGLVVFGRQLIILHLVGMLLVVAVGSNYVLVF